MKQIYKSTNVLEKWKVKVNRSFVSNSWQPHGLYSPWTSLGQNTGVGSLSLIQGIFPTQGLNPGLLHFRQMLYHLRHQPVNSYIITVEVIHFGPYYCYLKFLILSCYLCIWLCWVFITAQAFSPVVKSEGYSLIAVHRLSIVMTSLVAEHGL